MINDFLFEKAKQLKLYGLIAHWDEVKDAKWVKDFIEWEEQERIHRSLARRLKSSRIGRFKPLSKFDWDWPKKCDREAVEELMQLDFIKESTNIILCGPNGVGKTMIAKNIAHLATIRGFSVLFTSASQMLSDLSNQDGANALTRRTKYYVKPSILIVDEIGYLSYSNRYADLLFDIISQRYHDKPTIVTTNKSFAEWNDIFPNASCVVSIIDRLVHHSEIIEIDAPSFRLKEATEQSTQRKKKRNQRKKKTSSQNSEEGHAS
jgi:DNA replication protein DnaC